MVMKRIFTLNQVLLMMSLMIGLCWNSFGQGTTVTTMYSGLDKPKGMAFDSQDNLYVSVSDTILKITPTGTRSTFATGFSSIEFMAFDSKGNLYATDYDGDKVYKVTSAGVKSVLAYINSAHGITVDGQDNIYILSYFDKTITKITSTGDSSLFATITGTRGSGLAMDKSGNIYALEYMSGGRVYKITASGNVTTYATVSTTNMIQIAIAPDGNFYFAGYEDYVIYKIDNLLNATTYAGSGFKGYADGALASARFGTVYCLLFDKQGNMLISDFDNGMIRKIEDVYNGITNEKNTLTDVAVFPNPASTLLHISLPDCQDKTVQVEILDAMGRLVFLKNLGKIGENFEEQLNLADFKQGLYLVRIEAGDQFITKRVEVQ
jgi:hypothetical protein